MDALKRLYMVTAENLKRARNREGNRELKKRKLKVGDLVMVKDVTSAVFEPKIHAKLQSGGNLWRKQD